MTGCKEPCQFCINNKENIDKLEVEVKQNKRDVDSAINVLRNRLPVWATITFTFFGLMIGALLTIAIASMKSL